MSYITREMTKSALELMKEFHLRQELLHRDFDIDFVANFGRRNIIMSAAQEEFFALAMKQKGLKDVVVDGRTGQADIHIGELGLELECKLTTPLKSTGAINFQTDYATLAAKGSLDYLYVIASEGFDKFCVLHFFDLTIDDFRPLCGSARGKSSMIKSNGMQKCDVLWGRVETQNDRAEDRLNAELIAKRIGLEQDVIDARNQLATIETALARDVDFETGKPLRTRRRCSMRKMCERLRTRPERLVAKYRYDENRIREKIEAVRQRPPQYSFILHNINGE